MEIPNYTLDLVTSLLIIINTVFASDTDKPSIASHLKALDSSFQFCRQGPAFIYI